MQDYINSLFKIFGKFDSENILIFAFFILGYIISSMLNKEKNELTQGDILEKRRRSLTYFKRHQAENEAFFNVDVVIDDNQSN